jgi:prepilin-type N-terminal cleavage/methylation domain-containing protein
MKQKFNIKSSHDQGFTILEVVLASALFCVFSAAALSFMLQALRAENQAHRAEIALTYAAEGMEAVRAIRDDSFDNLSSTGGAGLIFSGDHWQFDGSYDEFDIYRRTISVTSAMRDGDGNIVVEGGTEDLNMKRIVSSVSFLSLSGQQTSTELTTYLSRWR